MVRLQQKPQAAELVLEDGSVFSGTAFGNIRRPASGEVVFTTGMVGYPESLTDPSYHGQIIVATYPLIGNYGVEKLEGDPRRVQDSFESWKIHAAGLVVSSYVQAFNHYRSQQSLGQWLKNEGIIGISGIDTRALTQRLREKGTMLGKIVLDHDVPFVDPNSGNILPEVSTLKPQQYGRGSRRIALIDCGVKNGIIRELVRRGCSVLRVPWDYPVSELNDIDGVVVSNGPGDPVFAERTIAEVRQVITKRIPVWGICLGHQIIALALGAKTYKLPYGHRGHNQPVVDLLSGRAYITSQNHGFGVKESTLPKNVLPWFRSLNDKTNEGFRHRTRPILAVQFHPEASPGPTDTAFLFDTFLKLT